MNETQFKSAWTAKYEWRVQEDFLNGTAIGISGILATVIFRNDTGIATLKVGAQPFDAFKIEIDKFLAVNDSRKP